MLLIYLYNLFYLLFTNKYSVLRLSKLEKNQDGAYGYMLDKNLYTKDYVTDILGLIRKNREARGWTEYQLAERSGLPQSTISSWYKKGMTPSFSSLEKICEAFGLTLSQFFADAEDRLALTPAQRALLDKWSRLTPGQQSSLLALMDAMLEK